MNSNSTSVTRRQALTTVSVTALDAGLAGRLAQTSRDHGKPLLVNETIPGCLDDAKRAEVVRFYHNRLSAAGFGWMGWVIREGRAISTRRDRDDGNGINGQGFHPFFTKEGKLRDRLDFLSEKAKLCAPWERANDRSHQKENE